MSHPCEYLESYKERARCNKPKTKACPNGKPGCCPCIPADFWNIATLPKKTNHPIETVKNTAGAADNMPKIKKFPAKNTAIQRATRPTSIRDISIFKSS